MSADQWCLYTPDTGYERLILHTPGGTNCRRVVVLDPEDREQVMRLVKLAAGIASPFEWRIEEMQAALRSLITPPRPEEPTAWLAAVEEPGCDRRWYRDGLPSVSHPWRQVRTDGVHARDAWSELPDTVRVLSEGVTS